MPDSVGLKIEVLDEEKFKAALKDVSASVKLTTSEMRKLSADYNGNANSITALEAKDRSLNQLTEEQKKKIQILREELGRSKDAYGEDSTKVKELQTKLNDAETALSKTTTQVKENNKYLKEAKSSSDGCATSIDKFGKQAKQSGDEVKGMGNDLDNTKSKVSTFGEVLKANLAGAAIVSGIRAVAGAIKDVATNVLDAADSIQQMSDQTGLSASKIQELQYVGDTVGVSIDTITGSYSKLIKNMNSASKGTGSAAEAFKTLGVSVVDGNGHLRDSQAVWSEAVTALGGITNETEQTAIAQQIFGKSASDLNPLIRTSSDELQNLAKQAHDSGAVMSDETVASLDDFGDSIGQLKQSFTGMAGTLLADVTPSLMELMDKIKGMDLTPLKSALSFVIENAPAVIGVITTLAGVFAGIKIAGAITTIISVLSGIGPLINSIQFLALGLVPAFSAVGGALSGVFAALMANPIVLIIAGIAAAAFLIIKNWSTIKEFFSGLWDDIKNIFSGVGEWFSNVFQGAKNLAIAAWDGYIGFYVAIWDGIKQVFSAVGNWFSQKFTEAKNLVMAVWNGVPQLFSGIAGKIGGAFSGIGEKIKSEFETGVNFIKELPGEALQWGKDMVNGFINGIKSMGKALGKAASDAAETVAKKLHHSKPDEGPLADDDTYMPDMMQSFADGIRRNTGKVSAAARLAAASISDGLNVGTTVNVRGIASPYGADAGGITTVNHTGVITIRGVNDQGQFVAAYDYVVDRMRREGRMA
ncbi:MAG: phage tail tape measure protein [Selenomonadaceae bacterium]